MQSTGASSGQQAGFEKGFNKVPEIPPRFLGPDIETRDDTLAQLVERAVPVQLLPYMRGDPVEREYALHVGDIPANGYEKKLARYLAEDHLVTPLEDLLRRTLACTHRRPRLLRFVHGFAHFRMKILAL
jgi:hypothetical protein